VLNRQKFQVNASVVIKYVEQLFDILILGFDPSGGGGPTCDESNENSSASVQVAFIDKGFCLEKEARVAVNDVTQLEHNRSNRVDHTDNGLLCSKVYKYLQNPYQTSKVHAFENKRWRGH